VPSPRLIGRFGRLWRGELPLNEAFWDWAVIGGLALNISATVASILLVMQREVVAAMIVGHSFTIVYNVVAAVGVWRSAARYPGNERWATRARFAVTVIMIVLSLT
jgi:hypothetical protein